MNIEKIDSVLSELMHERVRQISKGYDAAHDDEQTTGQLATYGGYLSIASCYQRGALDIPDLILQYAGENHPDSVLQGVDLGEGEDVDPRDTLIKAAALIVAEIERIDRERASE